MIVAVVFAGSQRFGLGTSDAPLKLKRVQKQCFMERAGSGPGALHKKCSLSRV